MRSKTERLHALSLTRKAVHDSHLIVIGLMDYKVARRLQNLYFIIYVSLYIIYVLLYIDLRNRIIYNALL